MSFLKNSLSMMGQSAVNRTLGFTVTAILSRLLGSNNFGIYSLVSSTASSVYGVVKLGTDAALTVIAAHRDENEFARKKKEEILGAGLILTLISAICGTLFCILFSGIIANTIFNKTDLQTWIGMAAIFVLIQALTQYLYSIIVGFQGFNQYSKVMVFSAIFGLVMTTTAAYNFGVLGAVIGLAVTQFVTLAMLLCVVKRILQIRKLRLRFSRFGKNSKEILKYGFPFYLAGLTIIPGTYFAQGLLVQFGGESELGGQRIVTTLVTLVSFVPTAIAPVILQWLAKHADEDPRNFNKNTINVMRYVWIFSLVTVMLATCLTPVLVELFFGKIYLHYTTAAYIALYSSIFVTLMQVVTNAIFAAGRIRIILYYSIIQTTVFTSAAYLMIPSYGLNAYARYLPLLNQSPQSLLLVLSASAIITLSNVYDCCSGNESLSVTIVTGRSKK